jgi:hypothetical protein
MMCLFSSVSGRFRKTMTLFGILFVIFSTNFDRVSVAGSHSESKSSQAAKAKAESQKPSSSATDSSSAFDVKHYDINLRIDPVAKSISGSVTTQAIAKASELKAITPDLGTSWSTRRRQTRASLKCLLDVVISTASGDRTFVAPVKLKSQEFEFVVNEDVPRCESILTDWVLRQEEK